MKFIELNNVSKVYRNGVTALANVSVSIDKGEFVFVIGLTASGKSTFIKTLYREEKPTSGTVMVGGLNVGKIRNGRVYKLRRKIGIVFQDFKLLPKLTVYENVAFALECVGMKSSEIRPRVMSALERVGLKHKVRSFPGELSGGEQQRVAIARAIAKNPKLLLCDEPTGALDSKSSRLLLETMSDINKKMKATILMVTHDPFSASFCERILFLKDGKIFNEIFRGEKSRKDFFNEILDILTLLGGEVGNVR